MSDEIKMTKRKTEEHVIDQKGDAQLKLLIAELEWEIDKLNNDYGEDYFARVVNDGNFSGFHFFIQLKSTRDENLYKLKTKPVFSYPISLDNIRQWYNSSLPVLLILWDVEQHRGYWLHVQPFITQKLLENPNWLNGVGKYEKPLYLPIKNIVSLGITNDFVNALRQIFEQLSLGSYLGKIGEINFITYLQQQLAAFQAMVTKQPNNPFLWAGKALIHYELYQMPEALHAINIAWNFNKDNRAIIHNRGSILTEYAISHGNKSRSMLNEAIELFQAAGGENPSADTFYNIGNSLFALERYEEAVINYDKALLLNPSTYLAASIWKNRGTCFFHLNLHDEEFSNYQKAIALNPHHWEAYASWAMTKGIMGDYSDAIANYDKAIEIKPELTLTDIRFIYWYAFCLFQTLQFDRAYEWVNRGLNIKPDFEGLIGLKANILTHLWRNDVDKIPDVIRFFEAWLLDNPDNALAKAELHLLYLELNQRDKARTIILEAINANNVPDKVLFDYALFLETEGNINGAIEQLEKIYVYNKEHHIVHQLARLKRENGQFEEAIPLYYEAMREMDEKYIPIGILDALGECFFQLKQYSSCARIACNLISLQPTNGAWWIKLSSVLHLVGKPHLYDRFVNAFSLDTSNEDVEEILNELE